MLFRYLSLRREVYFGTLKLPEFFSFRLLPFTPTNPRLTPVGREVLVGYLSLFLVFSFSDPRHLAHESDPDESATPLPSSFPSSVCPWYLYCRFASFDPRQAP